MDERQRKALATRISSHAGVAVRLAEVEELRTGRVVRLRIEGAPAGYPTTVIAKSTVPGADFQGSRKQFDNELASLRFLQRCGAGLAARPLAWDTEAGVMGLEEVVGRSLSDILVGRSASEARDGLRSFAGVLGKLHRQTEGHSDDFFDRRGAGDRDVGADRFFLRNEDLRTSRDEVERVTSGQAWPRWSRSANEEFEQVLSTLADPRGYLAFSNGDPCPDNVVVSERGTVLLDFEVGTYRHALLDAAFFTVPFPNCWCWRQLPADVVALMLDAYRRELRPGAWSRTDDERFESEYARCCAAWVVYLVGSRFGRGVLAMNRVHGLFSERQRMVTVLEGFAAREASRPVVSALASWAQDLAATLRGRWVDEDLDVTGYPAFSG